MRKWKKKKKREDYLIYICTSSAYTLITDTVPAHDFLEFILSRVSVESTGTNGHYLIISLRGSYSSILFPLAGRLAVATGEGAVGVRDYERRRGAVP